MKKEKAIHEKQKGIKQTSSIEKCTRLDEEWARQSEGNVLDKSDNYSEWRYGQAKLADRI